MRNPTVATVMTKHPRTVRPETGFKEIAETLADQQISAVPVVDDDGTPVGVVSEADLLAKEQRCEHDPRAHWLTSHAERDRRRKAEGSTARDLMTTPVHTVEEHVELPVAARLLARTGLRRLFVVREGKLVGVLSRRDVLTVFLRSDEQLRSDIEHEVFQRALGADPHSIRISVRNGTVTLLGRLGNRTEVATAGRLAALMPGVVGVRNRMDFVWDEPTSRRHR
ncbi:CBS domain-containing protein [Amycolatopsis cihanbeyliensis]|uniref:BON domain-containing protein n=1 Tax=Amycolatopsis cihanbeyliensis TaxID=1128664 RepID=A0A542DE06_AMYCI|nr:CBS domain-containing protein [Amycolatopsis cihanbeyliensis]TQJ01304.1 BON domain-containing protein [Amycolatopsis cihanbeyliensis]